MAATVAVTDPVSITGISIGDPYVNDGTSKNQPHKLLYDPFSGTFMYTGRHTSSGYVNLFWGKGTAKNVTPERGSGSSGGWPEVAITGSGSGYIGNTIDLGADPAQTVITSDNGWVAWLVKKQSDDSIWVIIGRTTADTIGVQADHPNFCHQVTNENQGQTYATSLTYVGDNQLAVIYNNDEQGNKGYIRVGTVSGLGNNASTITWGSDTAISTGLWSTAGCAACDTANKKLMVLQRGGGAAGNDSRTNSVVITINTNNSVSVGTWLEGTMGDGYFYDPSMVFNPDTNRFVCAFTNANGSGDGVLKIGSISGTTPSWGSNVEFNSSSANGATSHVALCYHPEIKKMMVGYTEGAANFRVKLATISNSSNTCTVSSNTGTVKASATTDNCIVYDTKYDTPIAGYTINNTAMHVQAFDAGAITTNATANNFIGFSSAAVSDGANATIQVTGNANDGQSGMTVAAKQYLQLDGSLGTTPPLGSTIEAGISLSATKLLIKA